MPSDSLDALAEEIYGLEIPYSRCLDPRDPADLTLLEAIVQAAAKHLDTLSDSVPVYQTMNGDGTPYRLKIHTRRQDAVAQSAWRGKQGELPYVRTGRVVWDS